MHSLIHDLDTHVILIDFKCKNNMHFDIIFSLKHKANLTLYQTMTQHHIPSQILKTVLKITCLSQSMWKLQVLGPRLAIEGVDWQYEIFAGPAGLAIFCKNIIPTVKTCNRLAGPAILKSLPVLRPAMPSKFSRSLFSHFFRHQYMWFLVYLDTG